VDVTPAKSVEAFVKPECNLSAAEQRVFGLVSEAKTNKEIAAALHISPATVKRHLEDILRKLQLRNRVEAAIYGLMMNACPSGVDFQCPLALWCQTVLRDNRRFGRDKKGNAAGLPLI
jgi:DNA-binding CsgD family transcriptional regulator